MFEQTYIENVAKFLSKVNPNLKWIVLTDQIHPGTVE